MNTYRHQSAAPESPLEPWMIELIAANVKASAKKANPGTYRQVAALADGILSNVNEQIRQIGLAIDKTVSSDMSNHLGYARNELKAFASRMELISEGIAMGHVEENARAIRQERGDLVQAQVHLERAKGNGTNKLMSAIINIVQANIGRQMFTVDAVLRMLDRLAQSK